ncbi:hypothetical protein CL630_02185 [bacterium]|mgnify:CR=1 FL=1|nr:hypothetical protein [bacterium]|tara:strand:+ start:15591 stop:16298 length:708 start_codon:yes stop_codon:yes gene_type:complete
MEYQVKLEKFEGPLDLLLNLIEKRKLHINDIALAEITDDYLSYLENFNEFPIGQAAHFILIASTLVLIKSRSLLPTLTLTEEEKGDIEELERRLREYQRVKALSAHVNGLFGSRRIFNQPYGIHITPVFSPTRKVTMEILLWHVKGLLASLPKKEMIPQTLIKKVVSIEETISQLADRIKSDLTLRFGDFAQLGKTERINVVVSFLALLELFKRGIVSVRQDRHFADITIEGKQS